MWCCAVWCGLVCGLMVWSCEVWCGLAWYGVVWCGLVRSGVVSCGFARFWLVWCGLVWFCVVWCGFVSHGMPRVGMRKATTQRAQLQTNHQRTRGSFAVNVVSEAAWLVGARTPGDQATCPTTKPKWRACSAKPRDHGGDDGVPPPYWVPLSICVCLVWSDVVCVVLCGLVLSRVDLHGFGWSGVV